MYLPITSNAVQITINEKKFSTLLSYILVTLEYSYSIKTGAKTDAVVKCNMHSGRVDGTEKHEADTIERQFERK